MERIKQILRRLLCPTMPVSSKKTATRDERQPEPPSTSAATPAATDCLLSPASTSSISSAGFLPHIDVKDMESMCEYLKKSTFERERLEEIAFEIHLYTALGYDNSLYSGPNIPLGPGYSVDLCTAGEYGLLRYYEEGYHPVRSCCWSIKYTESGVREDCDAICLGRLYYKDNAIPWIVILRSDRWFWALRKPLDDEDDEDETPWNKSDQRNSIRTYGCEIQRPEHYGYSARYCRHTQLKDVE